MSYDNLLRIGARYVYGDPADGVIGLPAITRDGQVIELSYFCGRTRPKSIVVISSQAGCPLRCSFCELGPERWRRNLTPAEFRAQAVAVLTAAAAEWGVGLSRTPHKITVANTGEPLLNPDLVPGLAQLTHLASSFKVSTVLPATRRSYENVTRLAEWSATGPRPVQLQISLLSTDEATRQRLAGGRVASFAAVRAVGERWRSLNPGGRRVNLSLMMTAELIQTAAHLPNLFPPELFRFRFREYVPTANGRAGGHRPIGAASLRAVRDEFAAVGYEVGDWGSPSPVERRFALAANSIRARYLAKRPA